MQTVIDMQQVNKTYGDFSALRDMNLQISQGEIIGLLGHNGAGKTTTIKLVLGMIEASSGRVSVFGESPTGPHSRSLRMQWGYLPESATFYEQLTGREVLDFFARLKRVGRNQRDALLEQVGLEAAAGRRVRTYSKGMRQRLGLAQALLGEPRLLLLDEPTVGLDPLAVRDFFDTLDTLRKRGTTVILSSHVLPGIERHIDRVAILRNGALVTSGTLDELRHEANVPLRIRAWGEWEEGRWEERLQQSGVEEFHVKRDSLTVTSSMAQKLDVMRLLLDDRQTQDIEVQQPSLEALYVHYMGEGEIDRDA